MKLSVIIVNYNVRYFLQQCLKSVFQSLEGIPSEVFVVDNNSPDDSVEMIKREFSEAILIENKKNVGFSKANNMAIEQSKGEYVLLLNPDTVVEEDTFLKCIDFMDNHPEAGGLGIKMIDGHGNFLPESKRGLPTPSTSFYKIFGLSRLFKKSKLFAKYHLGYLAEDKTNEIEVLSGAFMWMRKTVLEEVGYLDEAFFMYGEDIDLSYRITKAGYKNFYFPGAKIIHYKGESTKKGDINYVFVFYNAMIIFSKKHFAKKAKVFSFFISIAIYLRASIAIIFRFISRFRLPLIDTSIIILILITLNYLKPFFGFPNQIVLTNNYEVLNVLSVFGSFLLGISLSKGYSKDLSIKKTLIGLGIGSIFLVGLNSIFPEPTSFSNKYLISIIGLISIIIPVSRLILDFFNYIRLRKEKIKTILIVGNEKRAKEIQSNILKERSSVNILLVKGNNDVKDEEANEFIGKLYQLSDLISIYKTNEVVFSSNDLPYGEIIHQMNKKSDKYVNYKISLTPSLIIGGHNVEVFH